MRLLALYSFRSVGLSLCSASLAVGTLATGALGCATGADNPVDVAPVVEEAGALTPEAGTDALFVPIDGATKPDTSAAKDAPAPTLTTIDPTSAKVGALGPTLIVTGNDFVARSTIRLDGADLATTFVSATELRAAIPTAKLAAAGVLPVVIDTTTPGGGTSAALSFTVENPMPLPTTLTPSSVPAGAADTVVTIAGTDFAAMTGLKVTFGTTDLVVTASTSTSITATIPASLLVASGSFALKVANPTPGGGTSTPIAFTVTNPSSVSISSVTPGVASIGDGNTPIAIVGSGFVVASTVTFNGATITSTTTDATHIAATVPASALGTAGNFPIVVTTPPPGGGASAPFTFQVKNPIPTLASVSPNTWYYQGGDKTVTLSGSGFLPSSVARLATPGGTIDLVTTYVSPAQVNAVVPNSALGALGNLQIAVMTPAPGGGTSAGQPFYVTCDPTGVQIALATVGDVSTQSTVFTSAPTANRLNSGTCPTTQTTTAQPYRAWVVQNTSSAPVLLSSWAVCSSVTTPTARQDDAFLTFYKRSSVPATDAERKACTGVVAEGTVGAGSYASTESGGSNWCPGLTKANGGALPLGVCEKAVVYIAPYSSTSTSYTPPPQLRITTEAP